MVSRMGFAHQAAVFVFRNEIRAGCDENGRGVPAFRRPACVFGGAAQVLLGGVGKLGAGQAVGREGAVVSGVLRLSQKGEIYGFRLPESGG